MEKEPTSLIKCEESYGSLVKSSTVSMEKCLIARQMIELPEQMNEDVSNVLPAIDCLNKILANTVWCQGMLALFSLLLVIWDA